MKRLALIVGGITLFGVEEAFAAITCTASPDCATLGYTDTVGSCTNYVACPFDTSKVACLEKDCTDYTLSSCPTGGSCSVCQNSSGTKYKLDSCNTGYTLASSGTSCTAKTCSDYGYSTLSGNVCTTRYSVQLGAGTSYCYGGCKTCATAAGCTTSISKICIQTACDDICYTSSTSSVSGYGYGSCTCYTKATCGTTTVIYCPKLAVCGDTVL